MLAYMQTDGYLDILAILHPAAESAPRGFDVHPGTPLPSP